MQRTFLKSKIHRATITDANLNYAGSISIDRALCEAADLLEFEQVDIYNCNNGERFSTYVIFGTPGQICVNGAAARRVHTGDIIIIASFALLTAEEWVNHQPRLVYVDERNQIKN